VYARWTANAYTVTYNMNGYGTAPSSPTSVAFGTSTSLGVPNNVACYTFAGWFNNQTNANGTDNTGRVTNANGTIYSTALSGYHNGSTWNMTSNIIVYARWTVNTYTVTATAGANGSITPSGNVTVNCGANQTFSFSPANSCYEIDQVLINGVNNPAAVTAGSYTFENVTEPQTISVTFKIKTYIITATAGANGSITPSGDVTVNCSASQTFNFSPDDSCYEIDQVLVNGVNNPAAVVSGTYTFENVTATHTISVTFKIKAYTITAIAGANGSITPSGDVTVNCDANQTFSFSPANSCYEIDQVLVNGVNNPVAVVSGTYTFENVTATHTISVTFKIKTYIITATAGANGSITPSGDVTVDCGGSVTFTATPNSCKEVNQWIVNGTPVQTGGTTCIIENVQVNTTVEVTFKTIIHTITVSATPPAGGTATGGGTFDCGDSKTVTATANSGYKFVNWTRNGVEVSTNNQYSFTITEDVVLVAHFEEDDVAIVETDNYSSVRVYPNPTDGELRIESGELRMESVEIYDVMGRKALTSPVSFTPPETTLNIAHLPTGVYFLKIQTDDGVVVRKVVKN
ncbi:MAG: T9SS type A sorting domain-containing protein, partial [Bacteroidales bacterium]|nr:T9SS type A sorting domain-containing protein [Bacteroidales bacterium]